jgi:hypothetical protein
MLHEKLENWIARTFDELKQEMGSILRSIPQAGLISLFQTWLRGVQQDIDSGGAHI